MGPDNETNHENQEPTNAEVKEPEQASTENEPETYEERVDEAIMGVMGSVQEAE